MLYTIRDPHMCENWWQLKLCHQHHPFPNDKWVINNLRSCDEVWLDLENLPWALNETCLQVDGIAIKILWTMTENKKSLRISSSSLRNSSSRVILQKLKDVASSDCSEFQNPCGLWVWVPWVWVGVSKPTINPYPQHGLVGLSWISHGFLFGSVWVICLLHYIITDYSSLIIIGNESKHLYFVFSSCT